MMRDYFTVAGLDELAMRESKEVTLDDKKVYQPYFQDSALIGCQPSDREPQMVCVYRGPVGPFVGDDDGLGLQYSIE